MGSHLFCWRMSHHLWELRVVLLFIISRSATISGEDACCDAGVGG